MIFSPEYMEQWEREVFSLDARGVRIDNAPCEESEVYFPLWGIVDVDNYVQRSNRARDQAPACDAQDGLNNTESGGSSAVASLGKPAVQGVSAVPSKVQEQCETACSEGNNRVQKQDERAYDIPSRKARIAWGVLYWIKRVVIVLVVSVVASLLITMALNPSLTFFDAAHVLLGSIFAFFNQSFA